MTPSRAGACDRRAATHRPAIRTEALTKAYGRGHGVFALDLEVEPGEVLGFLGPNGAGKSTTMRLLLDLIRPTSGRALVLGLDAHRSALEIRRRVGFLPGDLALYGKLSGAQMLEHLAALRGGIDHRLRASLVERFAADLNGPIRELSTGNRQKIGLIQAFMHDPELLILDEPIAGLDPLVQQHFHELLAEMRDRGRTVLLSSHTLSEVERVADRVAILREGRLVVVDSLEHLQRHAVQQVEIDFAAELPVREFLALAGVRDVTVEGRRLRVAFEGSADPIVKAAADYEIRAIRSREDPLEDIFLRYYRNGSAP